jgi:transcriptional regulator with XRE-family HTH domain
MPPARTATPDAIRFGRLINDLRQQRGWNLQDFARNSHMTANYLSNLERGFYLPSLTAIINLAFVLGVDPGELVRHVAHGRKVSPPAVLPPLPDD